MFLTIIFFTASITWQLASLINYQQLSASIMFCKGYFDAGVYLSRTMSN